MTKDIGRPSVILERGFPASRRGAYVRSSGEGAQRVQTHPILCGLTLILEVIMPSLERRCLGVWKDEVEHYSLIH